MMISLRPILDSLRRNWPWVLIGLIVGTMLTIALFGCAAATTLADDIGRLEQQTATVLADFDDALAKIEATVSAQLVAGVGNVGENEQNFDPWTMRGIVAIAALPTLLLAAYMRARLKMARNH